MTRRSLPTMESHSLRLFSVFRPRSLTGNSVFLVKVIRKPYIYIRELDSENIQRTSHLSKTSSLCIFDS